MRWIDDAMEQDAVQLDDPVHAMQKGRQVTCRPFAGFSDSTELSPPYARVFANSSET